MINGVIAGQKLKLSTPVVAADSVGFLTAKFIFSSEWDNYSHKYVHFSDGTTNALIELSSNGEITEAQHLDLTAGSWAVWLHGNYTDDAEEIHRATSTKASLIVEKTGTIEGEPFPELDPTVVEAQVELAHQYASAAEGSASNAADSATAAAGSATAASDSATTAGKYSTAALSYRNQAQAAASEAKEARDAANASATSASGSATAAGESATAAAASEASAETAATNAGDSATSAANSATSASGYATAASGSATSAATAANTAEQAKDATIAAAEQAQTDIASAKTAAVSAVTTEGNTQVKRVQDEGASYQTQITQNSTDITAIKGSLSELDETIGDDPATDDKWQKIAKLVEEANSGYSSLVDLCILLPQNSVGELILEKLTAGNKILKDILIEMEGGIRYGNSD